MQGMNQGSINQLTAGFAIIVIIKRSELWIRICQISHLKVLYIFTVIEQLTFTELLLLI